MVPLSDLARKSKRTVLFWKAVLRITMESMVCAPSETVATPGPSKRSVVMRVLAEEADMLLLEPEAVEMLEVKWPRPVLKSSKMMDALAGCEATSERINPQPTALPHFRMFIFSPIHSATC